MSFVNVRERPLPSALRYLGDLISYRHLCWHLVGSDIRGRFRRTRLGILWALIQPLSFAIMIAYVWGALDSRLNTWEFALYVLAGHAVLDLFSSVLNSGQMSLTIAGGYLKQARIPLFVFQLRVTLTAVVFFAIEMIAVVGFGLAIGALPPPGEHLILVPVYVVFAGIFCCALSVLFSIAGTLYRDLRHASALLLRLLFFTSPVMMPREMFAQPHLKFLEVLNPLVPLLDMFRDPIMYGRMWDMQDVVVLGIWTVGLWAAAIVWSASIGRSVVFAI
jgi:lipopolysaccharide transport system permease protein